MVRLTHNSLFKCITELRLIKFSEGFVFKKFKTNKNGLNFAALYCKKSNYRGSIFATRNCVTMTKPQNLMKSSRATMCVP